jgi:7-cyano-7-deazaguanine synthase
MSDAVNGNLVLLSGGLDSSATLALYRRRSAAVTALFIDYGHPAAACEVEAARRVAKHYDTPLTSVRCVGLPSVNVGFVRGRNALLLQVALAAAPFEVGQIAMGLHSGTPYGDCSPSFLVEMQRCFDVYCDGRIQIVAPFIDHDKRAVVAYCRETDVPTDLTYSCERGTNPCCGTCLSCRDRKALHV